MNKKNLEKKDNVVNFPTQISPIENEIEAIKEIHRILHLC